MEFGIFLNGYIPGPAAHDTEMRAHDAHARGRVRDLRRQAQLEVRLVRRAPRAHRVQPHVGARGRDGLHRRRRPTTSTSRRASTASRRARSTRSATPSAPPCSTTSPTTASSGAPAAAPAATRWPRFNILDKNSTKAEWEEVVQRDPADVGAGRLLVRGRALHRADAAQRPAQAVRQGPPADLGRLRQPADVHHAPASSASAPSRSTSSRSTTCRAASTPTRKAIANCTEPDRPVQERQRDDDQLGDLLRDREEAREIALRKGRGYLVTMVNLYHDTMPKSQDAITWPSAPLSLQRPRGRRRRGAARRAHRGRLHAVRHARRGVRADRPLGRRRHGPAGVRHADRGHAPRRDPRSASSCSATRSSPSSTPTARTRPTATARPRSRSTRTFNHPLPEGVEWPTVIPESALVQL